jgi:hypothetical protein
MAVPERLLLERTEMLEGAAILLAGIVIGVLGDRLLSRHGRRVQAGPVPVCGCEHSIAFHDSATGRCAAMRKAANRWDEFGDPSGWVEEPCTCRRYTGPEPLPQFYAPEIADQGPEPTNGR